MECLALLVAVIVIAAPCYQFLCWLSDKVRDEDVEEFFK